jgi:hypothetical protein
MGCIFLVLIVGLGFGWFYFWIWDKRVVSPFFQRVASPFFLFLKIVALRQGCYEATISPVSCSTQPISGQVSYQKSVNLMSFSYVNDSYRLSLDECFGTWIHNGVWQSDESLTFKENKEVFFLTLKKLLDDNKVVFFPPEPNSKIKKYKYCSNGEYYVDSGEYEEELLPKICQSHVIFIGYIFGEYVLNISNNIFCKRW